MTIANQTGPGQENQRHPMDAALRALLTVCDSEPNNKSLREELLSLEKKLASNQLHLAVLGQMKRGKSSFINALLGEAILPTGVLPVTAVITEIKYGPERSATIVHSGGMRVSASLDALADYITEAGNPGNKRQVTAVEISYPSPLLESGIILIDTPGIGSTHAHNTRTTEGYLQQVDAAIFVLSVDPPITEVESDFIRSARQEIPKLFFVLNKTDTVPANELAEVSRFLERELYRLQIESPEIFPLSAREALAWKRQVHDTARPGGMEIFEKRLHAFLSVETQDVLARSVALDLLRIARTLRFAAAIGERARELPPQELDRKRKELDRVLGRAETELHDFQILLRQHLSDMVARVGEDLVAQVGASAPLVRERLKRVASDHPKETGRAFGSLLEGFLTEEVEAIFLNWRVREDEKVQEQLNVLSARFTAQANGILEQIRQSAGTLFEVPIDPLSVTCPLRVESHLYYRVERVFVSLDSLLLLLPRFLLRPLVLHRTSSSIARQLDLNAGRIRYDYLERLQSSMAQFEGRLRAAVTMLMESLKSALVMSNERTRRQGAILEVLDSVIRDCSQLLSVRETG